MWAINYVGAYILQLDNRISWMLKCSKHLDKPGFDEVVEFGKPLFGQQEQFF